MAGEFKALLPLQISCQTCKSQNLHRLNPFVNQTGKLTVIIVVLNDHRLWLRRHFVDLLVRFTFRGVLTVSLTLHFSIKHSQLFQFRALNDRIRSYHRFFRQFVI